MQINPLNRNVPQEKLKDETAAILWCTIKGIY